MRRAPQTGFLGLMLLAVAVALGLLASVFSPTAPPALALPECGDVGVRAMTSSPRTDRSAAVFEGQVTDLLSRVPIEGARVVADEVSTYTDLNGRYRLPVAPGLHEVQVKAAGYIGMSKCLQRAVEGGATEVHFAMVPREPTAKQQAALDTALRTQTELGLDVSEWYAAQAEGLQVAAVSRLPATVRLLMPDGIVVVLSLDEYVKGVVPQEMPPHWPTEALRAQAVIARCYAATARRHASAGADLCTTVHCQVWSPTRYETTDRAVDSTHNVALTHAGSIVAPFFFAHCDGHTRSSESVWDAALPYCRSVSCPCGHPSLLGHGVGLCQAGARVLANTGVDYAQILMHYYADTQVTALPPPTLSAGRVTPETGDTTTMFTYEVLYTGRDVPIAAHVYIDGHAYNMSPVAAGSDPESLQINDGRLYRCRASLRTGEHTYAFHFEDGYSEPTNLPTYGSYSGPHVSATDSHLPTPTAKAPAEGTQATQWAQSTGLDFAAGFFENTLVTADADGEVALAQPSTTGTYTSTAYVAPIGFVAVGSRWQAVLPPGTGITLSLRSSSDGRQWSDWIEVPPMDAEREESRLTYGELLYLRGPHVQYRVAFSGRGAGRAPVLQSVTLTFIDSRAGPTAEQALTLAIATSPPSGPMVIPRSAWGCNESWMTWAPEYRPPRKFVIHHTATANGELDPAATVRAIYYYHSITRGWGDIGYNYLIDTDGRIYEGRTGGEAVVGGHAKQYNWGSIGISLIGNYDDVQVPGAVEGSLIELVAWKGNLHFIDPSGSGFFIDADLPNVMGHRDGAQTTCPGRYAYARLPIVRQAARSRMFDLPPSVRIDSPAADAPAAGVVAVEASASVPVQRATLYVNGMEPVSDSKAPFTWKWDTTRTHAQMAQLRVEVSTALGLQAEDAVTVAIDNEAPRGSLSGPTFSNVPTLTLRTWADDAQWVLLGDGWLWEGEDLRHQTGAAVADGDAWNGRAWLGRAASDPPGWWYGPYFLDLPTARSYRAYFRLRTTGDGTAEPVATLDVSDWGGTNTYVTRTLTGEDLSSVYSEPWLDFSYYRRDDHGLEFRTFFTGRSDVYLDRVALFRAPRSYATAIDWILTGDDGPKTISARYLDEAGNVSPVYSATTVLDTTPPQWATWDGVRAHVRDSLSGLHRSSAEFCLSLDGGERWSQWAAATITATEGTTFTVEVAVPPVGGSHLRFRIRDRAGNLSESPVYVLPVPTATATLPASPTPTDTPQATATAPPTEAATPTPTHTAGPARGQIRGWLRLQGRNQHGAVQIGIAGIISATTSEDGTYNLAGVPAGTYTVTAQMESYLGTWLEGVAIAAESETVLPEVTLRSGDVNGDCTINLSDLVLVASSYGSSPPEDARADINSDGHVDLFDLLLVSMNLSLRCPGPWRP